MEHIMLYIRRILFMVRKEMLTTLKDPKSRIILIMPVIIQSLLFGYVASYNLDSVDYAVLDLSRSRYSEELLAELDGSGIFKRVATLGSTSQIARFIDGREAGVVLVIGHDFADKITAGETAPVQVITDGRNTMTSGIAAGYISAVAAAYNSRLHGGHQLLHIDPVAWYNPNLISRWGFLASLLPMVSLTQVMILAGLSVARERENGTFDQLMVTPLLPMEILIGKAVPPLLIGMVQSFIVLSIAVMVQSSPRGLPLYPRPRHGGISPFLCRNRSFHFCCRQKYAAGYCVQLCGAPSHHAPVRHGDACKEYAHSASVFHLYQSHALCYRRRTARIYRGGFSFHDCFRLHSHAYRGGGDDAPCRVDVQT